MKKGFYYICSFLMVCLLWSCSTKKNTKASRFYHAFNSRYNIYFNGKTSFDEQLNAMQNGYKESYSDRILMFPISAQPKDKEITGGPFDRAIEKGNKAIKLHSIKAKPAKKPGWRNDPKQRAWQEQEEYNPFLKQCWLMMGQGQFYNADFLQASATFSYIARHYAHDEEVAAEARLWQARCYAEMGWIYEAEDILHKLNTNGIPKKNLNQYATVFADYLVKNEQLEDAVPYLRTAIKAEKNKRQRTRMKYLLGQLYTDLDQPALAYKTFGEVIRANPPYDLEFAARIRQTEVFTGANYQKVINKLRRMAKNDKNRDLLDQVYYAMGNVYINREDTTNAIKYYKLGIEKSVRGGLERAICQIRLGDIYFQQRDYVNAQPCFSGAMAGLRREYKDYERVSKLSSVLDELVVHVEAVQLQDSLQTLARMPEAERMAVIDNIIERVKKEEAEAQREAQKEAYLAEQAAKGSGIDRPGTETAGITLPVSGTGSTFYFYNPQTVAQGKTAFQRKWGRRTLEDNWRRRKKEMSTFNEPVTDDDMAETDTNAQNPEELNAVPEEEIATDPMTREFYIQQLPLTPEDILASDLIIEDALYHMAMIYKDKLEDMQLAVEAFEELERRFPDNAQRLESYYQVYLMALRGQDPLLANSYKNKLIAAFPASDYAIAIADPNYEYNIRMMDRVQDSIYQQTYQRYLAEDVSGVRRNVEAVNANYPLADLMPKFMFLNALTYVQTGDPDGFKESLKVLIEKYPRADVTELAGEMLKGVLRGRALVQGGISGMSWNLRFGSNESGYVSDEDMSREFESEPNSPYRMMLMFPTGTVDRNQLLFAIAAYNFANFTVKELDLDFEEAGPMSMLNITGFYSINEIAHYYKLIYTENGYGRALDKDIMILPISEANYEILMRGKTLDEYVLFFEEQFGTQLPELAKRWHARLEAENTENYEPDMDEDDYAATEDEDDETIDEQSITQKPVQSETVAGIETREEAAITEEAAKETVQKQAEEVEEVEETERDLLNRQPADSLYQQIILPAAADTVPAPQPVKPAADRPKNLTLKDIEAIRRQEAEAAEAAKEEARRAFEAKQQADRELQQQKATEHAPVLQQQKAEEEAVLKSKADREKQLELDRKAKLKQAETDRKAKQKSAEELRKQKEKAYKERLKEKEKERKLKEKEYEQKLKAREKERREAQKAREAAAKRK